jgi:hypothetical protein
MEFLHGTCHAGNNFDAFKDLGLNSMRFSVPYPFASPARDMSEGFAGYIHAMREFHDNGIEPLCITMGPAQVPDWEGPPGSDGYFALARETAAFVVDQLKDSVRVWESTNEMNQPPFRAPLNVEQAVRFVIESARGVKDAGSDFWIGTNMGGMNDLAKSMYRSIYAADVAWDYVGVDGYFGTWEEGGPHTWHETFDWLDELAGLPVIVLEWGYSSAGDIMRPEDVIPNEIDNHEQKKWCFGWETGDEVLPHTFEMQGRYITEAMEIIGERAVGQYYYHWKDSQKCSCGEDDCPMEANWGFVDVNGGLKPSYYAMRDAIAQMKR